MPLPHDPASEKPRLEGLFFGFLGVLAFSLTLPATRAAVASLDPLIVGLGRTLIAACVAAPLLFFTRQPRPTAPQFRGLIWVILGVILGFPLLTAWAMHRVESSHGAVVTALVPLATAVVAVARLRESPSPAFWCAGGAGSLAVIAFALSRGGGVFHAADCALLAAVVLAALGYAEGGRLGREMGGWQVICWAIVLSVPVVAGPVAWAMWRHGLSATPSAWIGFAYVGIFSGLLGFFAWYHGLAVGGVARVSQIQLLQPFLTLIFAALFLGEHLSGGMLIVAGVVALSIFVSRRSKISTRPASSPGK